MCSVVEVIRLSQCAVQILGMAALACGMVAVGTGNAKVVSAILTCLVEKSEADLKDTFAKFLALGLGLTYLGMLSLLLCMYCRTGNVLVA